VLAPATLAALPSTRAIPNHDVFYVARIPATPFGKLGKGGLEVFDNRAVGASEMDGQGRRGD
jgi:hypothetical protein